MNESIQFQIFTAFKELFGIVQQQQQLITMTRGRLDELSVALAKQFEWEPPAQPQPPDPEMQSRIDAGLAELERMIASVPEPKPIVMQTHSLTDEGHQADEGSEA